MKVEREGKVRNIVLVEGGSIVEAVPPVVCSTSCVPGVSHGLTGTACTLHRSPQYRGQ